VGACVIHGKMINAYKISAVKYIYIYIYICSCRRWYFNITITILDIIRCPVFYLKPNVSETGFCLRFQAESTQLGPIDRDSLCLYFT
jgi:hypothetical protein